ncbi:MAG: hypothetical protein ACO3S9_07765 [Burkholderiaceae bacterium]
MNAGLSRFTPYSLATIAVLSRVSLARALFFFALHVVLFIGSMGHAQAQSAKPVDPASLPALKPLATLTGQPGFTRNEAKILQAIERCAALHSVIGVSLQESGDIQTGQENAEYGAYLAGVAIERRIEARADTNAALEEKNAALSSARNVTIEQVQQLIRHYMVEMNRSQTTTQDEVPKIFQLDLEVCKVLPKVVSATPASPQKPK